MKCPACGSRMLKCHHWIWIDDEKIDTGIWHEYEEDCYEPGHYICENGHDFFSTYDEFKGYYYE